MFMIILLMICGFAAYRNHWVYERRMEVLHDPFEDVSEQLDEYALLPAYEMMSWKFWIWDVEEFKDLKNNF